MKREDREALGRMLGSLMNECFDHGMAHQRLIDAQADCDVGEKAVNEALEPIAAILNTPGKKEIN